MRFLLLCLFVISAYSSDEADSFGLSIPEEAVGNPYRPILSQVVDGGGLKRNLCFCNYEGDVCDSNNTCIKHNNAACFHFIKEVYNGELRRMETVHQYGCASLEKGSSASHLTCNSFRSPHRTPKSIACCYEGDYCNLRITPPPYRQLPKEPEFYDDEWLEQKWHPLTYVVIPFAFALSTVVVVCFWRFLRDKHNNFAKLFPLVKKEKNQELFHTPEIDPMLYDDSGSGSGSGKPAMVQRTVANDLIIEKIIGKGRYGEVRIAKFRGSLVAVKTFYTTEEDSWNNEREVYETQMLNHENILQYVAADIFSMDSLTQMILVTDYHPHGSLYDYLQEEQALTTVEALQLAYSSICGIEHLHASVIGTGSRRKPQIAHRDIKSKNIIVKRPGMCCIADFGLAVRYEDRLIPEKVNIQVGTKRYMAPEVIKKTLNPNFFAEFKMADMYSYALVLWEIARKVESAEVSGTSLGCSESGYGSASSEGRALSHKTPTVLQHMQKSSDGSRRSYPYKPPFGELVDSDPSFAEMEKIVCGTNGMRPPLEPSWTNGSNVHLQKMIGLMVDCWHHSPHCRHTALKVKIAIGEVIEDLLQLQSREAKERNLLQLKVVDRMLAGRQTLGALAEPTTECSELAATS